MVAALVPLLGACARTGDFGRPEPSVINEQILPFFGSLAAHGREAPLSTGQYTDDEDELRDRSWRFLMPAHERAMFERELVELARTNIIPASRAAFDPRYYRAANAGPTRSPISRYRRLSDDILADRALIPPFSVVTARVQEADVLRSQALAALPLDAVERASARRRIAENAALVLWVCEKLNERAAAYTIALNSLVVEVPHKIAVESERALADLKRDIGLFCGRAGAGRERLLPPGSDLSRRSGDGPLVLKY